MGAFDRPALESRLLSLELSHMATADAREAREESQLCVQRKRNQVWVYSGLCYIKFRGENF